MEESEAKALLTRERSLFSRIVWSLLSLGLAALFMWVSLRIGISHDRDLIITQGINEGIANGGGAMWLSLSVFRIAFVALMLAVSFFIIKDYYHFFKELTKKLSNYFK